MKPIKSISGNCYMTAKPSLKSNSENDVSVILKCCHRSTGACSNGYSASKIICLQNVKDLVLSHCFQCCLIFFNFMKIESNKAVSRIWNKKQKTVISKFAVFPYRSVGNDQKEGPLHYSWTDSERQDPAALSCSVKGKPRSRTLALSTAHPKVMVLFSLAPSTDTSFRSFPRMFSLHGTVASVGTFFFLLQV